MKPIRLDLTNFTIFKGNHSIDFSGLRFFIIQGRTGSGKTSIVDAMCYALYGRVPRHGKENLHENIMSKGTDYLKVFFEFSVRGNRYAVERFVRRGKAGARFYENGKPKDVKINDIPEHIKRILGVDYDTFIKVILLPQGQFDRFLKPERPQQRREMLNKLLGVDELLKKINKIIRETKRQIENELTQIETSLKELSYATQEEYERIEREIEEVEDKLNSLNTEKRKLNERLNIAIQRDSIERELFECNERLKKLLTRRGEMEELERNVEKMEEAISYSAYVESFKRLSTQEGEEKKAIKELEIKIRRLVHEREEILEQMDIYEKEWKRIDEYDTKIEALTRKLEKLESAIEKIRERDRKLQDIEQTRKNLKRLTQEVENLKDRISRGEQFVREKEAYLEELENKQKMFLELSPIKLKLEDVKREREKLEGLLKENKTLEEELRNIRERIKIKEEELLSFHVHNIRSHLKQGDVCPVCGNRVEKVFYEELHGDFEQIKKELDYLKNQERNLSEKRLLIEGTRINLEQKEEELKRLLDGKLEYEFEAEYEELEKSLKILEEERKTLKTAKEKLENLKGDLNTKVNELLVEQSKEQKLKLEIEQIENYLKDAGLTNLTEQELERLNNELKSLKNRREDVRKKYTELSKNMNEIELQLERDQTIISQKEKNIENIREEKAKISRSLEPAIRKFGSLENLESFIKPRERIKELKDEIEKYKNEVNLLGQKKNQLTERLKDFYNVEPTEKIKSEIHRIEEEQKRYSIELGHLKEQKLRVEEGIKKKEELIKSKEELQKKDWMYGILEKDFGAEKLQEFLSQIMLERILERANFYMQKFTSGAYEYELENSDILIVDKISGYKRNVSTLSGGETFLASLSLAFGISDVLSHNSPIESLFIDEGFGSLDRETREELSHFFEIIKLNTDRVVGIISHLEDLAERFDQRIEVIRRGDRSFINVII